MAYTFYLDEMKLPVTPSTLKTKIKNNNKTITLINEGEVNLLKSAGLTDVSFSFLIPAYAYHFAEEYQGIENYLNKLESLKTGQEPFQFIVYRESVGGTVLFKTDMTVSLEDYEIEETADNGNDLTINVNLKQYREFGTKKLKTKKKAGKTTVQAKSGNRAKKKSTAVASYKVKSGDTLWSIAKKQLGSESKWKTLYSLNKSVIESTAKKHGYRSSSNGHWIFPGTVLKLR